MSNVVNVKYKLYLESVEIDVEVRPGIWTIAPYIIGRYRNHRMLTNNEYDIIFEVLGTSRVQWF